MVWKKNNLFENEIIAFDNLSIIHVKIIWKYISNDSTNLKFT